MFIVLTKCKYLFFKFIVVLLVFQNPLFILIKFGLEVLFGVIIVCYLLFDSGDLGLSFNYGLLGITHLLIPFYLGLDQSYLHLDWLTEFFEKLQTMIDEFVFSFIEFGDVGCDVAMVENGVSFLHDFYFCNYIY
jgi:hypothetical protein